jgi:hypothetical protein
VTKKEYQQQWRAKNPGYDKLWRARNPGKAAAANRRYRVAHPDRAAAQARRYAKLYPERIKAYIDRIRREHPDRFKTYRLKSLYGLTETTYQKLLASQGGVCAICKNPETIKNRRLGVDHCHKSGKVRGLLCDSCNTGLGRFRDSVPLLRRAIRYLEQA